MTRNAVITALVALVMAGFVLAYVSLVPVGSQPLGGMGAGGPTPPPVAGYAEGEEIRFIHTEASDPKIAKLLSDMMRSPVLTVPSLALAPAAARAAVYVFANGVRGGGPLGFQPDVFDRPPGDPGYSPLRAVNIVRWKDAGTPRLLKSAAEVKAAEAAGEAAIERPGVVVNMPLVTWPGGRR